MTEHPITPPPELIKQWLSEPEYVSGWNGKCMMISITDFRFSNICAKAAQWGADQELEVCCKLLDEEPHDGPMLHAIRRPKPPSLKEQALEVLMKADGADHPVPVLVLPPDEAAVIRRALEALPE